MFRPGTNTLSPFRFSFALNSVETALKYPHDLIASQVTKVEVEYGQKLSHFRVSVLEDENGFVSAFFRDMMMSDKTQPAQQFQAKLTYFEKTAMKATAVIVSDNVWIETFRTLGLGYSNDSLVENEVTLTFETGTISGEA